MKSFEIIYLDTNRREEAVNLAKQNEIIKDENAGLQTGNAGELNERKTFVEPAISVPVDVLEATTFFQAATSGATN
jgi:hypothetical protein